MMKKSNFLIAFVFWLGVGCTSQPRETVDQDNPRDENKMYSLLNEELPPKYLSPEAKATFEENLRKAEVDFKQYPDSLETIIWYGRRLAYPGKYLEAIRVYSEGLEKFPTSYRLRRHRGHRYITVRKLDEAIADFEMAAYYSVNAPNNIEPDGLPNRLNQPLGNDKFNIWYHYGLAHYLNGRYDKAISAYRKCMEYSTNDDLLTATSYWLYMTYQKIGNEQLASELLVPIHGEMTIIENEAYLQLLLLFKGVNDASDLLKEAFPEDGGSNPTLGYGIGNWYQQQGETDTALEIFKQIIESPSWDAFGYIAAEAELVANLPPPTF